MKWDGSTENLIIVAVDIAYNESIIGEYYSGMNAQRNKQRIIGYTRILTTERFRKIKKINKLFDRLQTNKVWVKPTILSSCYHVTIGWILRSHPSYTNYVRVTSDLNKDSE